MDEALRANERGAEGCDHRHHALADEWCGLGEGHRAQLLGMVMMRVGVAGVPRAHHARLQHPRGHRARTCIGVRERGALGVRGERVELRVRGAYRVRAGDIELRDQHAIRGHRLRAGSFAFAKCGRAALRIDNADHAGRDDPLARRLLLGAPLRGDRVRGARRRGVQALEDRGGLGDARGLEHHVIRLRALDDLGDAFPQVVLEIELAAHAATG